VEVAVLAVDVLGLHCLVFELPLCFDVGSKSGDARMRVAAELPVRILHGRTVGCRIVSGAHGVHVIEEGVELMGVNAIVVVGVDLSE
jgi:hypothetical protein